MIKYDQYLLAKTPFSGVKQNKNIVSIVFCIFVENISYEKNIIYLLNNIIPLIKY